jgi:signal transduction histidine kinase
VVNEIVAALVNEIRTSGARIQTNIDPTLVVAMDPDFLVTVLSNLVTNALKYGRNGADGHVGITGERPEAGWAEIAVVDNGPGVPAGALPHLFEPLFRASAGPGGYGLGLATTKRLVEAHGGTIAVDSAVGRGTTFRVRLPSAPSAQDALPG